MHHPAALMDWLEGRRAEANQAPPRPRETLWAGAAAFGTAEPGFLNKVASWSASTGHVLLQKEERGWNLPGDVTAGLAQLAEAMRTLGLAGAWRDEQLAVHSLEGVLLGTVERAAVRPLGITTHAVHVTGHTPDGRVWVQQRSLAKANDPGLWDTLMGGMVSAADTLQGALERETWEEAGMAWHLLQDVRPGGHILTRRPSWEGEGTGYMVEYLDWFSAVVPFGIAPVNLDGEVEQFELLDRTELLERLERNEFTLEASLILAGWLGL